MEGGGLLEIERGVNRGYGLLELMQYEKYILEQQNLCGAWGFECVRF